MTAADRSGRLTISALGPLEIEIGQTAVQGFGYTKVRALFVYLAVEARPHTRSSLATLLWPDLPDRAARANLSQALATLRRALGEKPGRQFVTADSDSLQLDTGHNVWVDATEFLSLVGEVDAHQHRSVRTCAECCHRLRSAGQLYRGDFLSDFFVAESEPFEEWAEQQRRWLQLRALGTFEHLASRAEWVGDFAEAAAWSQRQLAIEPLLEVGHRQLIRFLALNGEVAAAVAHYENLSRTLEVELGVAPEPETRVLRDRLAAGAFEPPKTAPKFTGPSAPTLLIGREPTLVEIRGRLLDGTTRALTLTGPGGVGKTRLALQAASDLRFAFEDGVYVVELAGLEDPALVAPSLAEALGLKPTAGDSIQSALITHLRDRHCLLVLDNFEHLLQSHRHLESGSSNAAAVVADILSQCAGVGALVTSRQPLRIRAERVCVVTPLDDDEAARLFTERATAVNPEWRPSRADLAVIRQICRRLDGLPLAIELVAAQTRSMRATQMLTALDAGLDSVSDSPADSPERHRTLRAAIAWSVERLSTQAREALASLSVFAGGGTVGAAADVVSSASGGPNGFIAREAQTLAVLQELADGSLITLDLETEPRFAMLMTVREYAREMLAAAGRRSEEVRHKHAAHYLALATEAKAAMNSPEQALWLDRLQLEHDNLRSVLARNRDAASEDGLRLAAALGEFWEARGHLREGRRWLESMLEVVADGSPELMAGAHAEASILARRQGDYSAARAHTEADYAIWLRNGDRAQLSRCLRSLGVAAWMDGDLPAAAGYYNDSLGLAREVGDQNGVAGLLNNLGLLASARGEYRTAITMYEESLPLMLATHDASGEANVMLNLGLAWDDLGNSVEARAYLDRSLARFQSVGHKPGAALVLMNLGNVALDEGDLVASETYYRDSWAINRDLGDRADASYSMFGLGKIALERGEHARARALMTQSLRIRLETGERGPMSGNLEALARLDADDGEHARAARLLGVAGALRAALGTTHGARNREEIDQLSAELAAVLGRKRFEAAVAAGRRLTLDEGVALAVAGAPAPVMDDLLLPTVPIGVSTQ